MAYMIYQQVTSAVRKSYRGRSDVAENLSKAHDCRRWIESLDIDPSVRASLVEPFRALEDAFASLGGPG